MPGEKRIPLGEYEHLCVAGVACEGVVEEDNIALFRVYCESTVVGYYENRWHMSYETATRLYEVPVAASDNTRVDTTKMKLNAEYDLAASRIKSDVKNLLIDGLTGWFRANYGTKDEKEEAVFGPREIKVDVPASQRKSHYQDKFGKLKDKIESGTIKKGDFDERLQYSLRREIDTYFACFDPNDPNHKTFWHKEKEEVGFGESLIPVWGPLKSSEYHFSEDNYFRGAAFVVLAISDVALVRSIATGIVKGAWKAGSHSWRATREWLGRRGYADKGERVHHWLIHNKTGKKYNIERFVNQPWNLKAFKTQSDHMRFGHGTKYRTIPPGSKFEQFRYGIPVWPKALGGSYIGRGVIEIIEE